MNTLRNALYRKNLVSLVITLVFGIFSSLISVLFAYLLQQILDVAVSGDFEDLNRLLFWSVVLILGFFLTQLFMVRQRHHFAKTGMIQYKQDAFEAITRKNIASFSKEQSSTYIALLTRDTQAIEENILFANIQIIILLVSFFGALSLMIWYNLAMTFAVILFTALPVLVSILFGKRIAQLERGISDRNEKFTEVIKDLLSGFFVIKSFQAEKEATSVFTLQNLHLEEEKRVRRNAEGFIHVFSSAIGAAMQIGVFLVGAYLALQGQITVGIVLAFVQLMNNIIEPVQILPGLLAKRKAAYGLIDKMDSLAFSNQAEEGTLAMPEFREEIRFDNVSFCYEENLPVLSNFNASFEKGKSYAIVGESGSGKSTILRLLLRSFEQYEGEIRVDGNELRDIKLEDLYRKFMIVQQDVFIFNASIRENITMFRETDPDLLGRALTRAGLSAFVAEKGLDFSCGENGANLSGGERQRISIARSLLHTPTVLLMDEATSSLDRETANHILEQVLQLEALTRIVVTHEIDRKILLPFNEILYLRNGKIEERGSYDHLIEQKGYFYSLVNLWEKKEEKK